MIEDLEMSAFPGLFRWTPNAATYIFIIIREAVGNLTLLKEEAVSPYSRWPRIAGNHWKLKEQGFSCLGGAQPCRRFGPHKTHFRHLAFRAMRE